ncbi:MAG: hypothetical protein KY447_01620 [Actinobacteria bacterium]|nr:hypothetical protein [Actinomycetota bacterium]
MPGRTHSSAAASSFAPRREPTSSTRSPSLYRGGHNQPRFHTIYGGEEVLVAITDGTL